MRFKLSLVAKVLAPAMLVAAVLTPGAVGSTSTVKLAVLPLEKAAIGAVAKPLRLSHVSGQVSNTAASDSTMGYSTAGTFESLGRVRGYQLDYGVAASGGTGVTDILTGVELYTSTTAAKRGLAFWKKDDARYRQLNQGTFSVTTTQVGVSAVGKARYAYLISYRAPNIVPLSTFRERFVEGKYVIQVDVSAGKAAAAKALAPQLARKLDARVMVALSGGVRWKCDRLRSTSARDWCLHAAPVKLAPPHYLGRPRGGPDLSQAVLGPADMTGPALVKGQLYVPDQLAISSYVSWMEPAGQFDHLGQVVSWYTTANEAAFYGDFRNALAMRASVPTLDLSSVGHGAQGVIDYTAEASMFSITVGQVNETVVVWNDTKDIQASDMQDVAKKLADRLDTLYTG